MRIPMFGEAAFCTSCFALGIGVVAIAAYDQHRSLKELGETRAARCPSLDVRAGDQVQDPLTGEMTEVMYYGPVRSFITSEKSRRDPCNRMAVVRLESGATVELGYDSVSVWLERQAAQ